MTQGTDFVYDIETYLNLFSCDITHVETRTRWIFEVSDRRDQSRHFHEMIHWIASMNARMFGFNNEGFDWPVCQHLCDLFAAQGYFTARDAYLKAQAIIEGDRFAHTVWPSDRLVIQGDLYKIHHFDNMARATSLKKLEIAMRSERVVDLPYSPHEPLSFEQMDEVIAYMCHDVGETLRFYDHTREQIAFRDALPPELGDVLNFNDTKIGKKYFENKLGQDVCYHRVNGRREPRQTNREVIYPADIISPKVQFNHPEFQRVLEWLNDQRIDPMETKGAFKDVTATIDGFGFDFGVGGIHGSVKARTVRASDTRDLIDVDVASYYPNLAIANRWFPLHLGEQFCDIYQTVYDMRREYAKGTAENAMLKLALNGVYGDSNNVYSPFYDPQYTMSITINGQLYLAMLAEWLMDFGCEMVQINTDGLTLLVDKREREQFDRRCAEWETHTGLTLEHAYYSAMHIRDVNNYIAVTTEGKRKRKGAYEYQRGWHQDRSGLVIPRAAEAVMVDGASPHEFVMAHRDPFDFMLSVKVPRSSRLMHGDRKVQNVTRYYVSTDGEPLTKVMPPLKGKTAEREIGIEKGWRVTVVNDANDFKWSNVNWLYYIEEVKKLCL